ncbi:MAG TPA: L-histidine N(alpha)-methyltransferase [Myxococcaceae bacterium]|nr:L-histidine N(alpha)-methyltransferase [Myxococcaceae bacterium]
MITDRGGSSGRLKLIRADVDFERQLYLDALQGLTSKPKELSPKWFYDERGSALFEAITRLPEYYLTSCEREILLQRSGEIAELVPAETLIELGSGTSEKTRLLLRAFDDAGRLRHFVAFDVDEATLRSSAELVASLYPRLLITAVVGDFERDLGLLPPPEGRQLIAFLGSTIGNLKPPQRARFFSELASRMSAQDALLLGSDLVKDVGRLEAAYNDSQGVTAEFNRNILLVLNRKLGANFVPSKFEHRAHFDLRAEWIEMLLRSSCYQRVQVPRLDLEISFDAAEEMRTEISAKFRRDPLQEELRHAGLRIVRWWTDARGDYALSLSVRE